MNAQPLVWLSGLAIILLILIGRSKGWRSLLALGISVVLIIYTLIPAIVVGHDPLFTTVLIGLPLLALIVYCTEGASI